jgi:hypothetical protein
MKPLSMWSHKAGLAGILSVILLVMVGLQGAALYKTIIQAEGALMSNQDTALFAPLINFHRQDPERFGPNV